MQYSKPTQVLVDEHKTIGAVLEAVEAVAGRGAGNGFPQEFFEKAVDFLATFADKCHHAKEEVHLFPLLEVRGLPREGGPIGCMLSEHEEGRAHVAAVREALKITASGDRAARETVRREALAYVELLRQHISKENNVLFRLADQFLSAQDQDDLWQKFQCIEHGPLPPGAHDKYLTLAEELRAAAGLTEGASTAR